MWEKIDHFSGKVQNRSISVSEILVFSADFFAKKRIYAYYSTNNTKKHVEHEREMISGMLLVFVAQNANSFRILIVFSGFWRRAVKRPSSKPHSGYVLWHSYIDKEANFAKHNDF